MFTSSTLTWWEEETLESHHRVVVLRRLSKRFSIQKAAESTSMLAKYKDGSPLSILTEAGFDRYQRRDRLD
jgi:hypothetical protein